jgi:hypothetical protein
MIVCFLLLLWLTNTHNYHHCLTYHAGSCCGITYNLTRRDRQVNAALWGAVFISVNTFMIYQLLSDRAEVRFTAEDLELYSTHFEEHGLPVQAFYRLVALGTWRTAQEGEILVLPLFIHKTKTTIHTQNNNTF